MEEQLVKEVSEVTALSLASQKINTGVVAFENRKALLESLAQESKGLKVSGIEDKAGLKAVSEKRKLLKKERVAIQNEAKEMRDGLTQINRNISEKEKELIAIIEPTEKELLKEEERIEAEKEAIRLAELEKERVRVQNRIDSLAEVGYAIDVKDVTTMSDDTFAQYLAAAKVQHEKEEAEKIEAARLESERIEQERIEKEKEAEALRKEREELEKMRAEQAEIKRQQEEAQSKIDAENKRIADEKAAAEQARIDAENEAKRQQELKEAAEKAAEAARLKAIQDAKDAEAKRIEDERKAKELEAKKAARAPDKDKIQKYIFDIKSVEVPQLKTDEAKAIMSNIQELIGRFDQYATTQAATL